MRRIRIACFSELGEKLGYRIAGILSGKEMLFHTTDTTLGPAEKAYPEIVSRFPGKYALPEWTRASFQEADALIFIASCGIAVRSIAPHIRSKRTDPAVITVDETGAYVIPILSGHMGRANDLADLLARRLGAQSVVTTATDRRQAFSPDRWAAENGFGIVNPEAVKQISSAVLDGEEIVLSVRRTQGSNSGSMHSSDPELTQDGAHSCAPELTQDGAHSCAPMLNHDMERALRLVPGRTIIGVGCRRGTDPEHLEACFRAFLSKHGIEPASVGCIASIDLKREEAAIRQLAAKRRIPFLTYSAEELMAIEGTFSSSEFVRRMTGADNVCERAAVCASLEMDGLNRSTLLPAEKDAGTENGSISLSEDREMAGSAWSGAFDRLRIRKESYEGVTFATARSQTVKRWEWI